jgi:hypothetical protein
VHELKRTLKVMPQDAIWAFTKRASEETMMSFHQNNQFPGCKLNLRLSEYAAGALSNQWGRS